MNTMKRLLCMLLVLTVCLGILVGCQEKTNDPKDSDTETDDGKTDDGTDDSDDTSGSATNDDPKTRDDLNEYYSFGDGIEEYVILSRATTTYEFESAAGLNGTAVESAIFSRNEEVMERCNVEISVVPTAGDWGDRDNFAALLRADSVLPNSAYDLVATHQAYLASLALEGLGWDFNELPNIDLAKRWWSEAYYNEVNYNGAVYMMYGDIAYTLYERLQVVFFNEQMAEDLNIDGLYELAIDGDWTFGKLKDYTTKVTTNMDAVEEDRTYGFMTNSHSQRAMCGSLGVDLSTKGEDGKRTFKIIMSEAQEAPLQDFIDFCAETPQVLAATDNSDGAWKLDPIFASGRVLFYTQQLGNASYYKDTMKDNYGLLPFPKYDEKQSNYVTGITDNTTGLLVPYNCENEEKAGTVTEMMSMISYRDVINEYYEERLKYQSFNNPLCVQTIEIIRDSFAPQFVMTFSYYMNYVNSIVSGCVNAAIAGNDGSVANAYMASSGTWRSYAKDIYEDLDAIVAARAGA